MPRVNLNRLLDTSKFLATKAGQELTEFITYVSDLSAEFVRCLRNGLTFADNFACKVSTISLQHNVATVINTDGKRPIGIIPLRAEAAQSANSGWSEFDWYIDASGQTTVKILFAGSPAASVQISVTLVILF